MPDQEPTAPVGARALYEPLTHFHGLVEQHADTIIAAQLASLRANGLVIVDRTVVHDICAESYIAQMKRLSAALDQGGE